MKKLKFNLKKILKSVRISRKILNNKLTTKTIGKEVVLYQIEQRLSEALYALITHEQKEERKHGNQTI